MIRIADKLPADNWKLAVVVINPSVLPQYFAARIPGRVTIVTQDLYCFNKGNFLFMKNLLIVMRC